MRFLLVWLVLGCDAAAARPSPPVAELPPAASIKMGSLVLPPCANAAAYCGTIMRPLDPAGYVTQQIPIAFRLYPRRHREKPPAGTILAQEGGPGYPTSGSAHEYLALFDPLRGDHDMLMVDMRGTGGANEIICKDVQNNPVRTPQAVGACGASLGNASMLYGTGLAADDMAAVLKALHIGKVDYYGDSYGTFFGQVFVTRHPDLVRSVVLDGAYPVIGDTPWYAHAGEVIRTSFNTACQRAPACAALPGSSLARIEKLLDYVRHTPVEGRGPDADGTARHVVVDPASIGNLLYDGTQGALNYREFDAAIRAYFDKADPVPLLRLVAENDANENPQSLDGFSYGSYAAVSCADYPQIYDMRAPPALRRRQLEAAVAAKLTSDPRVYGPLTLPEFRTVPLDISVIDLCLDWPSNNAPYPPGEPIPPGARFPSAPTLVINGELDMLTTPAEGAIVAHEFPHARHLVIANSFHVDAIYDVDDCAQAIVRRFVATLDTGDISCAARVKPVRLVPTFVRHAADYPAAQPRAGNAASRAKLAVAAAAVQTAGDAVARWAMNASGHDVGLRGGGWTTSQPGDVAHFTLDRTRWTQDLAVSGDLTWDLATGTVHTKLRFDGPASGTLSAEWNDRDNPALARLSGRVDGRMLLATMPAP